MLRYIEYKLETETPGDSFIFISSNRRLGPKSPLYGTLHKAEAMGFAVQALLVVVAYTWKRHEMVLGYGSSVLYT